MGLAIETARPWAVDVSSGVETGGVKDSDKIVAFADGGPPRERPPLCRAPAPLTTRLIDRAPQRRPPLPAVSCHRAGFKPAFLAVGRRKRGLASFPLSPPRRAVGAGFKPAFPGRRTQKRGSASFPLSIDGRGPG